VPDPCSFDKFRPISLCSVVYKICSKLIVNRLSAVLRRLVSEEQGAFLPGRSIFENICLTQEFRGGNIMMKIDMAKAYDTVDWEFLLKVLNVFGFSLGFCKLISNCVSSSWFSVVMNGTSKGFFKAGRGLRQGDPLSPYLFILVEEVFSRLLRKKVQDGTIGYNLQPRKGLLISHLLYADDMVIFSTGRKKDVRRILEVLDIYAQWSGQVVNASKSSIFFSNGIPDSRC